MLKDQVAGFAKGTGPPRQTISAKQTAPRALDPNEL